MLVSLWGQQSRMLGPGEAMEFSSPIPPFQVCGYTPAHAKEPPLLSGPLSLADKVLTCINFMKSLLFEVQSCFSSPLTVPLFSVLVVGYKNPQEFLF